MKCYVLPHTRPACNRRWQALERAKIRPASNPPGLADCSKTPSYHRRTMSKVSQAYCRSNDVVETFVPSPTHPGSPLFRSGNRFGCILGALLLVLLLAACGPESSNESKDQLTADAEQIALEYQTSGNLEQARTRL